MYQPVQLRNVGNSCHLNAVLQILFVCKSFNTMLLFKRPTGFANEYKNIYLDSMAGSTKNVYNYLKKWTAEFGCRAQDAYETMQNLFEKLHKSVIQQYHFDVSKPIFPQKKVARDTIRPQLEKLYHKNFSAVSKCFGLEIIEESECTNCTNHTVVVDIPHMLHLPCDFTGAPISVNDALNELFDDYLVHDVECECCYTKQTKTKRSKIISCPKYCLFMIKRCVWTGKRLRKLGQQVHPEEYINLASVCFDNKDRHYRLLGVINHLGTAQGGHYVASVRKNNQWFECNDNKIRAVKTANPRDIYVMLYELVQ